MPSERAERKLAAILAADVAGYSRLMGADEEGTLAALKAHRAALIDPEIAGHRGRVVKTTGDGMLIEFPSVVDAVRCAIAVQAGMAARNAAVPQEKRIEFRVGINLGDIIIDGDDIHGDGVNIAARLEGIAEPGRICISESAHHQVRDRFDLRFEDLGEQQLKNIARPVRVFRAPLEKGPAKERPALAVPEKPSIAVLPFQNMSGDAEQEYFSDGVVEEIITALSRMRWLFVIARNSSFTYKGRAVDVKQVGRELGVRYVLEGSVRKAGNRLRITGQLIDAATGAHLWADRFDGGLEDVFELQDRVTSSAIGAIAPKLEQAEIERAKRKPTESLDAYDYYLRGMASCYRWDKDAINEALELFYKAIARDPEFASAYGGATWCYFWRMVNGWTTDRERESAEVVRLAEKATTVGRDDAVALAAGGGALSYVAGQVEAGTAMIDRALALNPNLAAAWCWSALSRVYLRDFDLAIQHAAQAMRLSPLDPLAFLNYQTTGLANFFAGRYDQAWPMAERAVRERPNLLAAIRTAAASNAMAGRLDQARAHIARALELDPGLRISTLKDRIGPFHPEEFAKYAQALRMAGLPES